jgi:hypothetical protein
MPRFRPKLLRQPRTARIVRAVRDNNDRQDTPNDTTSPHSVDLVELAERVERLEQVAFDDLLTITAAAQKIGIDRKTLRERNRRTIERGDPPFIVAGRVRRSVAERMRTAEKLRNPYKYMENQ